MAADTTILNGDIGVWWLGANRVKMLDWIGGTNDDYTMNELYSAMQTLQDESSTIDDGTAFFADTPVEYTIGKIDSGDNDPFYITFNLMQRIKGGSLRTNGWARSEGSNTGIIIVPTTGSDFGSADLGTKVEHAVDNDGGTLLEVIDDGTDEYLVIRPDDSAIGNSFNTGSGTIQTEGGGAQSATQAGAPTTGDMIWANIYSIGTLDANAHLYVYQGARAETDASERVYSVNSTTLDYWGNGHFDICVPIKEYDSATWAVIDDGYLRVFARKGGDLFASFEVSNSTTSGGRNPVPMQTSLDLDAGYTSDADRGHGTKKISTGTWTGSGVNGSVITGGTNSYRAILDLTNSTVNSELVYWPIATAAVGGLVGAFIDTEVITGTDLSATANSAESDDGPAAAAWFTEATAPTITFANAQVDIDNDGTTEDWGITIDCNQNPLTEVYQWMKYVCQYGQGSTDVIETAEDLIFGEEYEGATAYFTYTTENGTNDEGDSVTQDTSGATGVIISHDQTNNVVLLRSTRGTFDSANDYVVRNDDTGGTNYFTMTSDDAGNFAASTAAPLGTFAGGTYFGARGVVLTDYHADDANSFILTDIQGTSRKRPLQISFTVTNLHGNAVTNADADLVAIYRLTGSGGDVDKDTMTCDGTDVLGDLTITVDDIPVDTPDTGRVTLVDVSDGGQEYVMRYSSWNSTTDEFTLAGLTPAALTGSTNKDQLVSSTDELDNVQRGDMVWNQNRLLSSYVTSVDAASNTLTISPEIPSQVSTDVIHINKCPITVAADDTAYVPFLIGYPTTDTMSIGIVYSAQIYYRVKVRNSRETDLVNGPIKPYSSDGTTSGTSPSIPTVRTIDTIIS